MFLVLVIIFSMLDAVFLYYRDIFSVVKDKGFLSGSVAKLATIYAQARF